MNNEMKCTFELGRDIKDVQFEGNKVEIIFDHVGGDVVKEYKYYNFTDKGKLKVMFDKYKKERCKTIDIDLASIGKRMEESKKDLQEVLDRIDVSKMMDADAEFGLYCDAIKQLHAKKNHDYGNAFGKIFKKYGMKYALAHMQEKLDRIEAIIDGDAQVNESINDSLQDLASYALMTMKELNDEE